MRARTAAHQQASSPSNVLYQYLDTIPIPKRDVDLLFLEMLGDFKLRHVYHFFVKHFGGRGIVQRGVPCPIE